MEKPKQTRERAPCEHCNTIHKAHKDSDDGCRLSKKQNPSTSCPTLSKNKKLKADKALDNLLEVDKLQDALFNAAINYDSDGSRTSSSFVGSAGSSDSDSSIGKTPTGKVLGKRVESDISLSSRESSASFHDSSSGVSELDDDVNPEMSDLSEESEAESEDTVEGDELEDPNWTPILLVGCDPGVFTKKTTHYPIFDTLIKAGPINIEPAACEPVDFFQLYFNTDIMADLVECTNAVWYHFLHRKI